MFRHEAVDRDDTMISVCSLPKKIRESRDNLAVSKYGSACFDTSSDCYTDLAKVAKAWQMMLFASDALTFH
jgi:hypothetical protein